MPTRISDTDKKRLYQAWLQGEDYVQLADQLNIKRGIDWSIVNRAKNQQGQVSLPRGGRRHVKLDEEIGDALSAIVEEHPTFTLNQIRTELHERLPNKPILSITSIARCLSGRLIVLKKMKDSPAERNSLNTKERRYQYAQWLLHEGVGQELIFIDESGINLWVRRTRGRAPRGHRAVRVVGGQRGRNFTVVFAVSNRRGLIHHDVFEGGMTCEKFNTFLENTSALLNEPCTYIFDNASCHGRAQLPAADGGPRIPENHFRRYLPPYSPFLNIVEMAFSAFKASLKRQLEEVHSQLLQQQQQQRLAILVQLAEQSVAVITPEKSVPWFNHTQRYLPQCLGYEDIFQ